MALRAPKLERGDHFQAMLFRGVSCLCPACRGHESVDQLKMAKEGSQGGNFGVKFVKMCGRLERFCCFWNRPNTSCFTRVFGHCHNISGNQLSKVAKTLGTSAKFHMLTYYLVLAPLAHVVSCFFFALSPACVPLQKWPFRSRHSYISFPLPGQVPQDPQLHTTIACCE